MTRKDPIVEEVREARRLIAQRFGNDPARYLRHVKAEERKRGRRVVRRTESVRRHRQWQAQLEPERFLDGVFKN